MSARTIREPDLELSLTRALFSAVSHFCRSIGVPRATISRALLGIASDSPSAMVTTDHSELRMLPVVADLLRLWHSLPEYTDESGAPRPLSRTGFPSIHSLAKKAYPADPDGLLSSAFKFGAVRSSGPHCRPVNRSAYLGKETAPALAYTAMVVARLTERIAENVLAPANSAHRWFERTVSQSQLRATDVPLFEHFVAEQGQLFVDTIDDWISHHSCDSAADQSVAVGVTAFAWSTGEASGSTSALQKPKKRVVTKRGDL
jgi:hypothetical protein